MHGTIPVHVQTEELATLHGSPHTIPKLSTDATSEHGLTWADETDTEEQQWTTVNGKKSYAQTHKYKAIMSKRVARKPDKLNL